MLPLWYAYCMKKITFVVFFCLIIILPFRQAFGILASPLVSKQGYGLGARLQQGSDSLVGTWNKVHFDFSFMYEGDTSSLKSFRLYEQKPGTSGFVLLVEFNNLLSVTSSQSGVSGIWSISRLDNSWIVSKRDQSLLTIQPVPLYEPISTYAPGTYSYYVTAIDTYGVESTPSQIDNLHVLSPIQIITPTSGSPAPLKPAIHWTVVPGWPENQVLYLIDIHDGKTTVWSKTMINKTGELDYDGQPLDPAKKYTLHIQGRWTSAYLKPLDTYFAGSWQDMAFQVSANPPPSSSPSPSLSPTPIPPTPTPLPPPQPLPTPTHTPLSKPLKTPQATATPASLKSPEPEKTTEPQKENPTHSPQPSPESPPGKEQPRGLFMYIVNIFISFWKNIFS